MPSALFAAMHRIRFPRSARGQNLYTKHVKPKDVTWSRVILAIIPVQVILLPVTAMLPRIPARQQRIFLAAPNLAL